MFAFYRLLIPIACCPFTDAKSREKNGGAVPNFPKVVIPAKAGIQN
jgi:hypothetical protein